MTRPELTLSGSTEPCECTVWTGLNFWLVNIFRLSLSRNWRTAWTLLSEANLTKQINKSTGRFTWWPPAWILNRRQGEQPPHTESSACVRTLCVWREWFREALHSEGQETLTGTSPLLTPQRLYTSYLIGLPGDTAYPLSQSSRFYPKTQNRSLASAVC